METESTLSPKVRGFCLFFLLIALGCNISVLFVPFLDFRELLKPEVYTFFHTIEMLWGDGLYALAILVIGFSLLFPFFKLAVLFLVVLSRNPGARLRKALNRVEMLAKWSMLDVFLVCLVLTLTSGQVLVGATPKGGVPLFMSAIVISMAVGQVLAHRLLDHSSQAKHFRIVKMDFSFRVRKFLVCVSGLTLLGALVFPFLKIESWFLVDSSFSVVTVIPALWSQSSYAAVVAVAFFLILFPVTRWVVLAFRTWKRPHGARDKRSGRIFELARFWSMLDVFALALAVFLVEGSQFVPADAQVGAILLVLVVFVNVGIERILEANPSEEATVDVGAGE